MPPVETRWKVAANPDYIHQELCQPPLVVPGSKFQVPSSIGNLELGTWNLELGTWNYLAARARAALGTWATCALGIALPLRPLALLNARSLCGRENAASST